MNQIDKITETLRQAESELKSVQRDLVKELRALANRCNEEATTVSEGYRAATSIAGSAMALCGAERVQELVAKQAELGQRIQLLRYLADESK